MIGKPWLGNRGTRVAVGSDHGAQNNIVIAWCRRTREREDDEHIAQNLRNANRTQLMMRDCRYHASRTAGWRFQADSVGIAGIVQWTLCEESLRKPELQGKPPSSQSGRPSRRETKHGR